MDAYSVVFLASPLLTLGLSLFSFSFFPQCWHCGIKDNAPLPGRMQTGISSSKAANKNFKKNVPSSNQMSLSSRIRPRASPNLNHNRAELDRPKTCL